MPSSEPPERIQKVLARAGLGSRRQVESWISAGRVQVNGAVATLGSKIGADDRVLLDGRPLRLAAAATNAELFVCHRSPGDALRPSRDSAERKSLLERLPRRAGKRFLLVSPMPRIDGGLELATADGELASRLQHAVRGIEVEFLARVRGELHAAQCAAILRGERDAGAPLELTSCEPATEAGDELTADPGQVGGGANHWYRIVGRGVSGADLRQLLERCSATVSRVIRIRIGGIALPRDLPRGAHRAIAAADAQSLLAIESQARDAASRAR